DAVIVPLCCSSSVCSFYDTATTESYTLSLHDALPICPVRSPVGRLVPRAGAWVWGRAVRRRLLPVVQPAAPPGAAGASLGLRRKARTRVASTDTPFPRQATRPSTTRTG